MTSAFNEHQQDYMRWLGTLPAEAKCACGWYPVGQCPNCAPERGGFERCGADGGYQTLCSRKKGHEGVHWGWPACQVSGSLREWSDTTGGQ